jgi:hypothetical protein
MISPSDTLAANRLLRDRDLPGIQNLLEGIGKRETPYATMRWFRVRVLANQDFDTSRWFWVSTLQTKAGKTLAKMVNHVTLIMTQVELKRGIDYKITQHDDGLPVMHLTANARHVLLDQLPVERHGSITSLVRTYDPACNDKPEPGRSGRSAMGG